MQSEELCQLEENIDAAMRWTANLEDTAPPHLVLTLLGRCKEVAGIDKQPANWDDFLALRRMKKILVGAEAEKAVATIFTITEAIAPTTTTTIR